MQVHDRSGYDGTYIDNSVRSTPQRLDTRNSRHYGAAHFDAIGSVMLAHSYANRQAHVLDMLDLLSTTGTGSRVLAELKALSEQGVCIAIGPRDDVEPGADRRPLDGVATTVDGQVLWDCDYRGYVSGRAFDAQTYQVLIGELVQVRNLAAEKAWPGVPPLQRNDVESAFMAELALRTAPAVGQSQYVPTFPAPLDEFDAAYMPEWGRGPIHFDSLGGLMPAWFTVLGKDTWNEVLAVLRTVAQTAVGRRLLSDLWVYGRSRAVMLVHSSASGKDGVRRLDDQTPIWSFNKASLAGLALSDALTDTEAQASGAFLNLLAAHAMLASKLGMLGKVANIDELQNRFEQQLIEDRDRRMTAAAGDASPSGISHSAWPLWQVEAARNHRSPLAASKLVSRPRAHAVGRAPTQDRPAVPTAPVPSPPPGQARVEAVPETLHDIATRPAPSSRQNKGVARWLQNSARAFARTFNPPSSVARNTAGRQPNPYAAESLRRHSGS